MELAKARGPNDMGPAGSRSGVCIAYGQGVENSKSDRIATAPKNDGLTRLSDGLLIITSAHRYCINGRISLRFYYPVDIEPR